MNKKLLYLLALCLGLQTQTGVAGCKKEERINKFIEQLPHGEREKLEKIFDALKEGSDAHHKQEHGKVKEEVHKLANLVKRPSFGDQFKSHLLTAGVSLAAGVIGVVVLMNSN